MRYDAEHKERTRALLLKEAARAIRAKGPRGVSVATIMGKAGLTHGGFYAHFKSKDDLVETALQHAVQALESNTAEALEGAESPLQLFIQRYLSDAHRANPGVGCPLPTMSAELGQRGEPSATTDAMVRNRLALIEKNLEGENAQEESVLMLSAMVGALLLSRSVKDPELSDRLLKTTRHLLIEQAQKQ